MKVLIGQTDGLPNITGTMATVYNSIGQSGALYGTYGQVQGNVASGVVNDSFIALQYLDASRSNSIYGKTNYVRTKNVSLKNWLRIS